MKLKNVDKVLNISIEVEELTNYINDLDSAIVGMDESDYRERLKTFSIELTRALQNSRDW